MAWARFILANRDKFNEKPTILNQISVLEDHAGILLVYLEANHDFV
jgi:hypothetical protein